MKKNKKLLKCLFGHHTFIPYGPPNAPVMACSECGLCKIKGKDAWTRWDSTGRKLLYRKFTNGDEEWYKYDEKGRISHFRKSDGVNVEYDYSQGKLPKQKVYDGPCVAFTEIPLNP